MIQVLDGGALSSYFLHSPTFKGVPVVFLTAAVTKEEVSLHAGLIGRVALLGQALGSCGASGLPQETSRRQFREQSPPHILESPAVWERDRRHAGAAT